MKNYRRPADSWINPARRPRVPTVANRLAIVALLLAAVILIFAARLAPYLEYAAHVITSTVKGIL